MRRWDAETRLYRVPRGENDDWYWIYASVLQHEAPSPPPSPSPSRDEGAQGLPGAQGNEGSGQGQGAGKGLGSMMVVTNDQMRDHWLDMVDPGAFVRWKQSQMLRFDFNMTNFVEGE